MKKLICFLNTRLVENKMKIVPNQSSACIVYTHHLMLHKAVETFKCILKFRWNILLFLIIFIALHVVNVSTLPEVLHFIISTESKFPIHIESKLQITERFRWSQAFSHHNWLKILPQISGTYIRCKVIEGIYIWCTNQRRKILCTILSEYCTKKLMIHENKKPYLRLHEIYLTNNMLWLACRHVSYCIKVGIKLIQPEKAFQQVPIIFT